MFEGSKKINACLSYNTHRRKRFHYNIMGLHVNYAMSGKLITVLFNREI